jgi:hypothetical protein
MRMLWCPGDRTDLTRVSRALRLSP